jgi:hypothetical protein
LRDVRWDDATAQQKVFADPEAAAWPRAKFHQLKSRSLAPLHKIFPRKFLHEESTAPPRLFRSVICECVVCLRRKSFQSPRNNHSYVPVGFIGITGERFRGKMEQATWTFSNQNFYLHFIQ